MNRRAVGVAAAVAGGAAVLSSRPWAAHSGVGAVGARLQEWMPAPPASMAASVAVKFWAAPVTLVGLVAGAGAAVPPRLRDGVVLFAPARGITGALIRRRGFAATALGHVVVAVEEPSPALMAHELMHVRQAERLGPLFLPAYLVLLAVHGYRRHPLEQAARAAVGRSGRQA